MNTWKKWGQLQKIRKVSGYFGLPVLKLLLGVGIGNLDAICVLGKYVNIIFHPGPVCKAEGQEKEKFLEGGVFRSRGGGRQKGAKKAIISSII